MHPLSVCEFDPILISNINPYDTKDMMTQLCINKMKLGMPDPKEVFNDEDFVNKVRFFKTEITRTLDPSNRDLWELTPIIYKRMFITIPDMEKHIKGIYVCKAIFSGKVYIEHFILLKEGIIPYMSFRVPYIHPYINGIYECVQSFISKNKFSELEETNLLLYLVRDRDDLVFGKNDPFLYKNLRICIECMKRIAYV